MNNRKVYIGVLSDIETYNVCPKDIQKAENSLSSVWQSDGIQTYAIGNAYV